MKPISIYIHIPFCVRKCAYCDFASFAGKDDLHGAYFDALRDEIEYRKDMLHDRLVCSVFFGGGTPSLVDPAYIVGVLEQLRKVSCVQKDAEITMEANPGTVDADGLKTYLSAGINRLSFGVQSFDNGILHTLGRIHNAAEAEHAVRLAYDSGFQNISADLMYALPGQDMRIWYETLQKAIDLPLSHISAYSLIIEDGTAMERMVRKREVTLPDEDTVIEMQRMATHILKQAGYERYEISNYAKAGMESKHNMVYWTDGDYLGLGSAAHSLVENVRFSNSTDICAYIAGERGIERSERNARDHMEEVLMLSTRTTRGLNIAKWQEVFKTDFLQSFSRSIQKVCGYGLAETKDNFFYLTEQGMELQDSVVLELLEDL